MFQTTNQNESNLSNTCAFGNPKPTGHIQQGLEPPHCYIKVPSQQRSHSAFSKSMCAGVSLWQVQVSNTRNVTSNHWIYLRELYSKGNRTPIFRAENYVFSCICVPSSNSVKQVPSELKGNLGFFCSLFAIESLAYIDHPWLHSSLNSYCQKIMKQGWMTGNLFVRYASHLHIVDMAWKGVLLLYDSHVNFNIL